MSYGKHLIIFTVATALWAAVGAEILPSPMKHCTLHDEACILEQVKIYFREFKYGLPAWNIPSVEPLQLGTLRIKSGGASDSMQFSLIMRDTTLHHFSDRAILRSVKGFSADLTKPLKLIWIVNSPDIEVRANYEVDGKLLILPIVSKGTMVINLSQMQSKTRITAVPEQRPDGHSYLKVTDYKTVAKVSSGSFNMSNLFDDNVELRDSTLKVLNDEWSALSADIQPKILEAADRAYRTVLQMLFDKIPYDEFFLKE
ncbi:circadian clock-controlled protein daywake [Drosophila mojavensis]|uniref:Circadian clock-controlled protein n=1 Tax=Drosophila mojavensis TaxID=7230 RepID=B4L633_DROMO|nr:circadian clock-controlled protein daywake [Drosophila mojavensis]EDW05829.2 uncharacterized protein Dmoj_GI16254 [Drosophila mojavensis]